MIASFYCRWSLDSKRNKKQVLSFLVIKVLLEHNWEKYCPQQIIVCDGICKETECYKLSTCQNNSPISPYILCCVFYFTLSDPLSTDVETWSSIIDAIKNLLINLGNTKLYRLYIITITFQITKIIHTIIFFFSVERLSFLSQN